MILIFSQSPRVMLCFCVECSVFCLISDRITRTPRHYFSVIVTNKTSIWFCYYIMNHTFYKKNKLLTGLFALFGAITYVISILCSFFSPDKRTFTHWANFVELSLTTIQHFFGVRHLFYYRINYSFLI